MKREITRRRFLQLSATAAAGALIAACSPSAPANTPVAPVNSPVPAVPLPTAAGPAATAAGPAATAAPISLFKEAPMLADLVKAGKLPAVDLRLPKNPMVMAGYEGVGKFGGAWRRAFQGVSDTWGPTKVVDRAWAWFDKNLNLIPRSLESWSVSADGKTWTIKMRQGLKWSDGKAEHTTDDFAFWYQYEFANKKLTPGTNTPFADPDKTPVKFVAVDKYTSTWTYTKPKPMFIYNMTRGGTGGGDTNPLPVSPSHYMKQFHEDTTTDKAALDADIKKRGFTDWQTYYMTFARRWNMNPDRPTLGAWVAKNDLTKEIFTMERNPYFWAVDSQGNQLPYVDTVTHRLYSASAPDVLTLRVTNGEIDFQYRLLQLNNLPVYKAGEAKGDYKTILGVNASHVVLTPNMTTKNKPLAEFFSNRSARIAMSLAVNRDNMNQLVYNGLLKPRQYSPMKESPQYYEKLSNAYLKYDPDTANKMLDDAGYTKKDADGTRLYRDGSGPISFTVEGVTASGTTDSDACNLMSKDFQKIGIKAAYKFVERSLYTVHFTANDIEAGWFGGDRTFLPIVPEAVIFRGVIDDRPWARAYGLWYNNPNDPNAVKPPDGHFITNIWKIWDEEVSIEPDVAKQTTAFKKILDIWATELPMVGFLGEQPSPTIVKNGFKGYPPGMPNDDTGGDEQFCQSETYYWDDPSKHTGWVTLHSRCERSETIPYCQ